MRNFDAEWIMNYGCARVSTDGQILGRQLADLKVAGCPHVIREKIIGAKTDRRKLNRLMAALPPGDVAVMPAVDRASSDTTDPLLIACDMQPGAGPRSLAESVVDRTTDFAELVLAMLGDLAKLERTARGRAETRANGVHFGRTPKLAPHQQREARDRLAPAKAQPSIDRTYNVCHATISRLAL